MLVLVPLCGAGLLGAGQGAGSCAAPPYRVEAAALAWSQGCPPHAEVEEAKLLYIILLCPVLSQCCSEFGYCHGRAAWARAQFRDCNGLSNGAALPPAVLAAELREREMGRLAADDQLLGAATENEELIIIG